MVEVTKNQEEFEKLGNIFKFLKFSPRMFEEICIIARHDLETIRSHERIIQSLCVRVQEFLGKTS
ncbi:MAG: hypothetical protein Ct9H90mP6_00980 [Gammaproteobacteria bacterium]|nr:MAG: hypothetical protein Ct9H90mP6_00980 [Gammaproteobacteria bacterium]